MITNDNIYNIIYTHRLPVSRNKKPVKEFLSAYFSEYVQSLTNALLKPSPCILREECYSLLNEKLPVIKELCSDIIKTFDLDDLPDKSTLNLHFNEMMKKIEEYLSVKNIRSNGSEKFKSLYRIRPGESNYSRKDMFHISYENRGLIKSYRYSIAGHPCLYLSTGVELCWFECDMPKKFSYSSLCFNLRDDEQIKLINFTLSPNDLISGSHCAYHNDPDNLNKIDMYLIKYLITHPIRTACSIQVANRDQPYIEEYIFPQHLLLWIREHDNFDGVAYNTSSSIEKAQEWNYFNIVLPAKQLVNGYCKKLAEKVKVSQPVKVDYNILFENRRNDIKKVQAFMEKLEKEYSSGYSLYPYREILSLCKTFLLLCDSLNSSSCNIDEVKLQAIDTLNLQAHIIIDNIEAIKQKSIDKEMIMLYDIDRVVLEGKFDCILNDFSKNVIPLLSKFWNFESRIRTDTNVDRTTYECIL